MTAGVSGMPGSNGGQGDLYSRLGRVEEAVDNHKAGMRDLWEIVNTLKGVAHDFKGTGTMILDKLGNVEKTLQQTADRHERLVSRVDGVEDDVEASKNERKGVNKIVGPLATATGGGVIAIAVQWFTHWVWPTPPGH